MEKRLTIPEIRARKGGAPLVVLTAYTEPMARLLDGHVDVLLVGDSLGMVVYGMESTLPVALDTMIAHGRTVVGSSSKALVVVDMPFGSYQASPAQAFESAARVMRETGAQGVKLEGGREMEETIRFLVERGVPVMGHVGLMPQHFNALGGYRAQGRDAAAAKKILENARAVERAGAFAVVIEGTEESLAKEITRAVGIPTIGIGASPACDGQVLVVDDLLGLTERAPKFVRQYADLSAAVTKAVKAYAADVRARRFPGPEHCFVGKKLVIASKTKRSGS